MKEIELKFQIPAGQVEAVQQAIVAADASHPGLAHHPLQPLPLHAAYCDTPDHALARHKMALRVRQEGPDWVQTFKGAGADAMTRLEENLPVPSPEPQPQASAGQTGTPPPDLAVHSTEVRAALQRALPHWAPATDPHGRQLGLHPLYETRFERWHAVVPVHTPGPASSEATASQVMLCLDLGQITAPGPAHPLTEPLAELELELLSGSPLALLHLARQWVERHGLWLDVQSKAMKGTRLTQQAHSGQHSPARAVPAPLACPPDADAASRRAWLSAVLDACTGNWAEVARGGAGWLACVHAWAQALQVLAESANAADGAGAALLEPLCAQALACHAQLAGLLASGATPEALLPGAIALATHPAQTLWALSGLEVLYSA